MINKFVLEGWIREKIVYYQSGKPIYDPEKFYFNNHKLFCFEDEIQPYPIKRWEYIDEESIISFRITFGYDQIGIEFTITDRKEGNVDRVSLFNSAIKRVIKAYNNFKDNFLKQNCPSPINIKFDWQPNLLLLNYGYTEGLTEKQQEEFLNKLKTNLEKFTGNVKFVVLNEGVTNPTEKKEIKGYTMREMQELMKLDFKSIIVFIGEVYLFVNHHLFGKQYFLDDPSLSLITVAEWGLISSLKLQDIHFEIEKYSMKWKKLKTDFEKASEKTIIRGLGQLNKELIEIEKSQTFVEYDLREFTNLAEKIIDGIKQNENKAEIYTSLNSMTSLPDSLHYAKGILRLNELGRFSNFKREILELETDLKDLETKSKGQELSILAILFVIIVPLAGIAAGNTDAMSYFADFLQILTFGVAFVILFLRFYPKR